MSRSNPTANNPNPCTRWFEWKGSDGKLVWYDKEKKESVDAPKGFRFLVLDQLSTVTGYNKKKKSGIHSNEVRDARANVLVVKLFEGGDIATGLWSDIKEKVVFNSGKFAASVYIAYKDGDELRIGNIRMSGCALGPWFDFAKKHRRDIDQKAVAIRAGTKDTSGSVDFIPPVFTIVDTSPDTDQLAKELDGELQEFLATYFKRPTTDKLDQRTGHAPEDERQTHPADDERPPQYRESSDVEDPEVDEDDIPF